MLAPAPFIEPRTSKPGYTALEKISPEREFSTLPREGCPTQPRPQTPVALAATAAAGTWRRDGSGDEAGGGSGIRTRDTVPRIHTFQACAFNHSATPPGGLDLARRRSADKGSGARRPRPEPARRLGAGGSTREAPCGRLRAEAGEGAGSGVGAHCPRAPAGPFCSPRGVRPRALRRPPHQTQARP
jgi:hypothetical protein